MTTIIKKMRLSAGSLDNFLEEMDNLSSQLYEDEELDDDELPQNFSKPAPETIKLQYNTYLNVLRQNSR